MQLVVVKVINVGILLDVLNLSALSGIILNRAVEALIFSTH